MEGEINPFANEDIPTTDEIIEELARVERQKQYLMELLAYYEPTSDLPTDL